MTVTVEVADKTAGRAELRGHRERLGCVRKASAAVAEKHRGPEGVAALDAHLYEITDTIAIDVHHRRIFQNLRRSLRRDRNPLDRRMTVLDANDDQGTVFDRHEFLCAVAVDVHGLE